MNKFIALLLFLFVSLSALSSTNAHFFFDRCADPDDFPTPSVMCEPIAFRRLGTLCPICIIQSGPCLSETNVQWLVFNVTAYIVDTTVYPSTVTQSQVFKILIKDFVRDNQWWERGWLQILDANLNPILSIPGYELVLERLRSDFFGRKNSICQTYTQDPRLAFGLLGFDPTQSYGTSAYLNTRFNETSEVGELVSITTVWYRDDNATFEGYSTGFDPIGQHVNSFSTFPYYKIAPPVPEPAWLPPMAPHMHVRSVDDPDVDNYVYVFKSGRFNFALPKRSVPVEYRYLFASYQRTVAEARADADLYVP